MLIHEDLTHDICGAAIEVHTRLGPGLLESAYEQCLCHELMSRDIEFQRQVSLPVIYKAVRLDCGYKMDVVVDAKVILELKCVDAILPIHEAQLLTYLRLSKMKIGLLLNFNTPKMKEGIKRFVV
jgi:GxxExxY protein